MSNNQRIVVTGLGAMTPFGAGVSLFWDELIASRSAVSQTEDDYLRQWAPVIARFSGFDPKDYLERKSIQRTDRFSQLGLVAAQEALRDAGWSDKEALHDAYSRHRMGISIGCAYGGVQTLEQGAGRLATGSSTRVSPRLVPKSMPNAAGAEIARQYEMTGPVMTYSTACASSANAIGEGSDWLRLGKADMVLAGGAECLFSPSILAGLRASQAIATTGPENDSEWSRPFDRERQGMVMGEGAAMLVLETLEHAQARNATIYAELTGYGASNDAYHETAPDPKGFGAKNAIQEALNRAEIDAEAIDYINAHATATFAGDQAESATLSDVFGQQLEQIPVSSIKGAIGHLLGAAGAIESIASIKALETQTLPPTLNCTDKDDTAPPDIVPNHSRPGNISSVLSNSFGFGGQNGVLIWQQVNR
ncbi:beta-ketoacyl-[acyl-carrier-protein] synthase family protein [Tuberibacillus sp. Marseille-P3662]|uniref:beta-ketoacyl-[acyl-carrier-protein] synthase family protein n=1 Tax=Tuberibacillus sp. Marseille-P3662 TaxID=1965358 RepID=UPI000A1CCDD3|nr:beta-ketoacyl-[acyl-carrier-protein] synthase family protein [Tuberibacillus sp. Marseille-P3662]